MTEQKMTRKAAELIAAGACAGGLAAIEASGITDPAYSDAIRRLHDANVALREALAPAPSYLVHERFREGLGVYRPTGSLRWGQGTEEKPDRAGTYRPEHLRVDNGLHFDIKPDRAGVKNPGGRDCFECGYIETKVPCFVDFRTVYKWTPALGFWPGGNWLASAASGGYKNMELDGPEDHGPPPGGTNYGFYSLACHMGFDGMDSPPFINAQAHLLLKPLGKTHWHPMLRDTEFHEHGIRVTPDGELHIRVEWLLDDKVVQTLFTGDFEKLVPARTLNKALAATRAAGWNARHMTQITGRPEWQPPKGFTLPSALVIDEVRITATEETK